MNIIIETAISPYTGEKVGGAETSLRLIAEELAARGHEVVFITKSQKGSLFGFNKKVVREVKVITFFKFKFNLLNRYFFKTKFKTLRLLVKKKYLQKADIVHFHYNIPLFKLYSQLKNKYDYKLVVRVAGLKPFEDIKKKTCLKKDYQSLFKDSDLLNFISSGLLKLYQNSDLGQEIYLHNESNSFIGDIGFRDVQQIDKKYNFVQNTKELKIVMASRFSNYQKRQDILIDTMELLKDKKIHLTLIGSGPKEREIKERVNQKNLDRSITIIPFLKPEDLWEYMQGFNLMVHACDYEGLSKIVIESMGYGLPVLASNVLPLNDYIIDGKNGYLVKNEPKAWAEKLLKIKELNDLKKVSKQAKTFIKNNYDSKKNVLTYENQFLKLIENNE